ncbi:hypothetical protein BJF96_g2757 [Verticillium dahliae]|uniref:Uncharacterized protein n=1 Tax=Verticillium dahliae TaxID=27337 RepID=A0AA44WN23_VERDA|nr:hypothetical protein BJF96_g2757 [Verticillium dahliae]
MGWLCGSHLIGRQDSQIEQADGQKKNAFSFTWPQVLQNIQRSVSLDACGLKPQRGLAADDIADEPWAHERNGTVE